MPDSKIGDAVSYTLNQWEYLTRYTEDDRMLIDNNLRERDIRIFTTGRKSSLFSDTVDGARASAVVYNGAHRHTERPRNELLQLLCERANGLSLSGS